MDRKISETLYEVENPIYQSFEEMKEKYIDRMVIITNRVPTERHGTRGGVVRYYGRASDDFYDKWDECCKIDEYDPVLLCSFAVGVNLIKGFPI